MCFIVSNVVDIVTYALSIDFHSRLDKEQLPSFTQHSDQHRDRLG